MFLDWVVTYRDIKMWGKCILIVVVYSSVIIVTTGVGTKCIGTHWRKLVRLPGDTHQASAGGGAGRLPSGRNVVDRGG